MSRRSLSSLSIARAPEAVRAGVICALSFAAIAAGNAQERATPRPTPPAEKYGAPVGTPGIPPPGASSCSACHPASTAINTPVKQLVGRNPEDIVAAVKAFRSGEKPATIMDRIAKGFTDDEIKAIADWYGAQKSQ